MRSDAFLQHPLVVTLCQGQNSTIRECFMSFLNAASAWALHKVVPAAKFGVFFERHCTGSKYISEYAVLCCIEIGLAGPDPTSLLQCLTPFWYVEDKNFIRTMLNHHWAGSDTVINRMCEIRYEKSSPFNWREMMQEFVIQPVQPMQMRRRHSWPKAKGTLDYIFKMCFSHAISLDAYCFRLIEMLCDPEELDYWQSISGSYAQTILGIDLYNAALYAKNLALIPILGRRNNLHGMTALQLYSENYWTTYFQDVGFCRHSCGKRWDAEDVYAFFEYMFSIHGHPLRFHNEMLFPFIEMCGQRNVQREDAILQVIIAKAHESDTFSSIFEFIRKYALKKSCLPFLHALARNGYTVTRQNYRDLKLRKEFNITGNGMKISERYLESIRMLETVWPQNHLS